MLVFLLLHALGLEDSKIPTFELLPMVSESLYSLSIRCSR